MRGLDSNAGTLANLNFIFNTFHLAESFDRQRASDFVTGDQDVGILDGVFHNEVRNP